MASDRMRRVDEAVRDVLGDAIAKDLQDPRVGFVTVTAVKTSSDLRHARVYVSVLGDETARAASLEGLRSAHGVLQRALANELRLKHTPTLTFEYDESVERGMRITGLLSEAGSGASKSDRSRMTRGPRNEARPGAERAAPASGGPAEDSRRDD